MKAYFLVVGFLAWLIATLVFRFAGQYFLKPEDATALVLTFVITAPVIFLLMRLLLAGRGLRAEARRSAAVYVALPGMLLDVLSTLFFQSVFPNMSPTADKHFGALMLWGYAMILMSGFVASGKKQNR